MKWVLVHGHGEDGVVGPFPTREIADWYCREQYDASIEELEDDETVLLCEFTEVTEEDWEEYEESN